MMEYTEIVWNLASVIVVFAIITLVLVAESMFQRWLYNRKAKRYIKVLAEDAEKPKPKVLYRSFPRVDAKEIIDENGFVSFASFLKKRGLSYGMPHTIDDEYKLCNVEAVELVDTDGKLFNVAVHYERNTSDI